MDDEAVVIKFQVLDIEPYKLRPSKGAGEAEAEARRAASAQASSPSRRAREKKGQQKRRVIRGE